MDHKKRLHEIAEFLKPYQRIWENEIMLLYPEPLRDFPVEWIDELAQYKNSEDVIRLERKDVFDYIKSPSLLAYYQRIEELCRLPGLPELPTFPERKDSFLYMVPKKQHEIRRLAPFVNKFYQENGIARIFDIGGGVGFLAQTLSGHYHMNTTSLDMDPVLQRTGQKRSERKEFKDKISYITVKVDEKDPSFKELLKPECMTLGLHTCGPLANHQIKASALQKIKGLISFGCCYDKLQHAPASQNISQAAKGLENPLHFNAYALTLATRAHRKMEEKDHNLKKKVKFYRYAIHFLLHDEYGYDGIVSLGNSHPKLYEESFGAYAVQQFERLKLPLKHTIKELNDYFDDPERQELIWRMLTAGLIRDALGRLLEIYILLDRALYLEEHSYDVQLLEFFEEPLSPRNLGIVAIRETTEAAPL